MVHNAEARKISMGDQERAFYSSENGDEWRLVRNDDGHVTIKHVSNIPSGGQVTTLELAAFLDHERHSPQNRSLHLLIATLVSGIPVISEAQGEADLLDAIRTPQ
jgi:hypothetical protein